MTASGVETIYLIHHSHTDIGYTHDQPVVWDLHRRFLDEAIALAERDLDAGRDGDDAFRWTIETTSVLEYWLQHSSSREVERLKRLVSAGRAEVTAMLCNITPLYDTAQLLRSFNRLRTIEQTLGTTVCSAMNSDVNGENWPLVDILIDLGIQGFSMAINTHFGGALQPQPLAFHWQAPSGRSLLAWNGFSYGLAREMGIGRDARAFAEEWWPRLDRWLAEIHYPLPVLMLQIFHPSGDNGSADEALGGFIREWNARGEKPRLRMALPDEWWQVVDMHADHLPICRGDWTDYWNFGCGSSARETAINRANRERLFLADSAHAALRSLHHERPPTQTSREALRSAAQHALNFWDEHTWGANISVREPYHEDTLAQWIHKASYAHQARSLSLLLARDGVAELARHISREPDDAFFLFNPLPWERTVAQLVPDFAPERQYGRASDPTASRHWQDRPRQPAYSMHALRLPAFGYTVVTRHQLAPLRSTRSAEDVVETDRYRLVFDRERGGIRSWFDKALARELVDPHAGWPFHGFVHERIAEEAHPYPRRLLWSPPGSAIPPQRGWRSDWPAERRGPAAVLEHTVEHNNLGIRVTQRLAAPGVDNLIQEVFLPDFANYVECRSRWEMTDQTAPEATYLAFPLDIPNVRCCFDVGGQAVVPERDQLRGACRDYFTVQRWLDLSNGLFGIFVASPTTPMVQLGDFTFGKNHEQFSLARGLLLGWATNNYWETNFRAHQPGLVETYYRFLPYSGAFFEHDAH
ncbi:MAG: hypothetical protein M1298_02490, partial [Chloroflexi bacterium]|nr:hypothetical protein [Chloroflexota bacterium]